MKRYEIWCTPEQTRKALKLGAPIETDNNPLFSDGIQVTDTLYAKAVTAEQMINWLEEQEIIREVHIFRSVNYEGWYYSICGLDKQYIVIDGHIIASVGKFPSRKEATLAAIDAALEYLANKKMI